MNFTATVVEMKAGHKQRCIGAVLYIRERNSVWKRMVIYVTACQAGATYMANVRTGTPVLRSLLGA